MPKEKVASDRIAELVCHQLGHAALLSVYPIDSGRFVASIMAAPGQAIATQRLVDAIVVHLNRKYELVDEITPERLASPTGQASVSLESRLSDFDR